MFFRLSAHSPRESGARRMCCSSWQILHLVSVRVEPGPEISRSSFFCGKAVTAKARSNTPVKTISCLNYDPHAMPAVPEVAERVPVRHRGLRVAAAVPGARMERARRGERGVLPGLALVAGELDALHRAFPDPGAAAHEHRVAL